MKKGDYVLATKWYDGDPRDHWAIGYYDRKEFDSHFIVDIKGDLIRPAGFRRAKKISKKRGDFLLDNIKNIHFGDRSIWWWEKQPIENSQDVSNFDITLNT